jgi:hypothetical protein
MDANKVGFYLISMPADKIATVCVMHLMKVLLAEFTQSDKEADISAQMADLEVNFTSKEIKIPAITLFSDLGQFFNAELK